MLAYTDTKSSKYESRVRVVCFLQLSWNPTCARRQRISCHVWSAAPELQSSTNILDRIESTSLVDLQLRTRASLSPSWRRLQLSTLPDEFVERR